MVLDDYSRFIPCWDKLNERQRSIINENITIRKFMSNESVIIHSAKKDGMIFVLEGNLRVYIASAAGREMTLLNIRSGSVFCIMTVDKAKEKDVIPGLQATEKSVMAYIPRAALEAVAFEVPDMAEFIFDAAADMAQAIINSNAFYFFNTLRGCVAKLIAESCEPGKDSVKITHEEIANSLATTRVVISRELEMLAEMGFIETHRGRIRILDRDGLDSFARRQ